MFHKEKYRKELKKEEKNTTSNINFYESKNLLKILILKMKLYLLLYKLILSYKNFSSASSSLFFISILLGSSRFRFFNFV